MKLPNQLIDRNNKIPVVLLDILVPLKVKHKTDKIKPWINPFHTHSQLYCIKCFKDVFLPEGWRGVYKSPFFGPELLSTVYNAIKWQGLRWRTQKTDPSLLYGNERLLNRQWWRLHISEKFSRRLLHDLQSVNLPKGTFIAIC
jgi:hypothetical protein